MRPKSYYPLFADLHGRRCVVVGGGKVAQQKVKQLRAYGAAVHVVSPEVLPVFERWAQGGQVRLSLRRYRASDLKGAWLVVAATNDSGLNERVYGDARARQLFCNVVDERALCSFIVPAMVRRGLVQVAISTGGSSPTLAKKLKQQVATALGSYPRMVSLLRRLRGVARRRLPGYAERKRFFHHVVEGEVFRLVEAGRYAEAQRKALALLDACVKQVKG
jgi:siroheme synthase-like protein